jgi:UTP--glucose-1-phosphate uridylyltransferase
MDKSRKITSAVFPVAGLGTRFLPATKSQPKEMLPLVDKPMIQYVVEEARASGIEHIVLITGRGKNAIEDHFDLSIELEQNLAEKNKLELLEEVRSIAHMMTVSYVRQKEPLGLGHAILCAKHLIGSESFAVFLGDDIVDSETPCMAQMLRAYEETGSPILAVEQVPMEEVSSYGVMDGTPKGKRLHEISSLVEKPPQEEAPSNLAIIGRYILPPEIFPILEKTKPGKGGEIQLTDALKTLLETDKIYGYEFEGTRYDTGNKLGFLKATVEFALKRPGLGEKFRDYLKTLSL